MSTLLPGGPGVPEPRTEPTPPNGDVPTAGTPETAAPTDAPAAVTSGEGGLATEVDVPQPPAEAPVVTEPEPYAPETAPRKGFTKIQRAVGLFVIAAIAAGGGVLATRGGGDTDRSGGTDGSGEVVPAEPEGSESEPPTATTLYEAEPVELHELARDRRVPTEDDIIPLSEASNLRELGEQTITIWNVARNTNRPDLLNLVTASFVENEVAANNAEYFSQIAADQQINPDFAIMNFITEIREVNGQDIETTFTGTEAAASLIISTQSIQVLSQGDGVITETGDFAPQEWRIDYIAEDGVLQAATISN